MRAKMRRQMPRSPPRPAGLEMSGGVEGLVIMGGGRIEASRLPNESMPVRPRLTRCRLDFPSGHGAGVLEEGGRCRRARSGTDESTCPSRAPVRSERDEM